VPKTKKEVIYKEFSLLNASGKEALDYETAVELIGWQMADLEKGEKFENPLFRYQESDVVCSNNICNRPFNLSLCKNYKADILNKAWELNGQPIILSKYGNVLSGQHRVIALILAVLDWREDKSKYPKWKTEPKMDTAIAVGISEERKVVNTIDTGKSRSLADAIIASGIVGVGSASSTSQKRIAKGVQYAVMTILEATGIKEASFSKKPSHSFCLNFLDAHPKIIEAVELVLACEGDGNLSGKGINPFRSCGLFYLMAASESDQNKYVDNPIEKNIDFSQWGKASTFFDRLSTSDKTVAAVFNQLSVIEDAEGSTDEKEATLKLAWHSFAEKEKVTPAAIKLDYVQDEETGLNWLASEYCCGNLDTEIAMEEEE